MNKRCKLTGISLLLVLLITVVCVSLTACGNSNYVDKKIKGNNEDITIIVIEKDLPQLSTFLGVKIIRNEMPDNLTTQTNIVLAAAEWFTDERVSDIKARGYSFLIYENESDKIRQIATKYGATPSFFTNVAATLNGAIIYSHEGQEGCEYLASVDMEKISEKEKLINTIKIGIYFCLNNYEFTPE